MAGRALAAAATTATTTTAMELSCISLDSGEAVMLKELQINSTVRALKYHLVQQADQASLWVEVYKSADEAKADRPLLELISLRRCAIKSGDTLYYKFVPRQAEVDSTKRRRRTAANALDNTSDNMTLETGGEVEEKVEEFQVDLGFDSDQQHIEELDFAWGDFDAYITDQTTRDGEDSKDNANNMSGEVIPMTPPPALMRQRSYVVIGNMEISQMQKEILDNVMEQLDVDASRGVMILRAFDWDVQKVEIAWEEDKEAVLKLCKIADIKLKTGNDDEDETTEIVCGFCFSDYPTKETYALNCGHRYCMDCWQGWANASFDKGHDCVFTECPFGTVKTKCHELMPPYFLAERLEPEKKQKFEHWLRLAFVKQNVYIKWCPRAGCDKAVEYKKKGMKRVQCACSYTFCFGCGMEDHEPSPCTAMREWMAKNSAESGIFKWLKSNAKNEDVKTCTKCHIVIQKNQGCKHMTCTNCRHEFCWLCFQNWNGHDNTYCTQYTADAMKEEKEKKTLEGDEAGTEFRRYQFYHARWENYKQAVEFGIKTKENAESRMEALQNMKGTGLSTVKFLVDAIDVLIDCRKLLEWSYVWCYYLKDKDSMMALFRNHLNNLEDITEDLGMLVEQPLEKLILDSSRTAVINKSRVLTKYRRNIVDFAREHDEHVKEGGDAPSN
eukprot:gb/GEZN01002418.1/.p1 GENE.gb/GEZN01002418.1/~~gb/GEZN01002418.1/.p1  ORF type:complete len:669 (-),score=121.03 gb/GEZN01002418.1/:187-2193(-)